MIIKKSLISLNYAPINKLNELTLIAQTTNKGHPILIGDLLLSSNKPSDELTLPSYISIPKINDVINTNFPQNIKQKTYIISDNLAISLGGVTSEMHTFLEDIKSEFIAIE